MPYLNQVNLVAVVRRTSLKRSTTNNVQNKAHHFNQIFNQPDFNQRFECVANRVRYYLLVYSSCLTLVIPSLFTNTEKPKWVIWAIVGQHTDKITQKLVKNESFCPCSDPLWLKWVKWLIWVYLWRGVVTLVTTPLMNLETDPPYTSISYGSMEQNKYKHPTYDNTMSS